MVEFEPNLSICCDEVAAYRILVDNCELVLIGRLIWL